MTEPEPLELLLFRAAQVVPTPDADRFGAAVTGRIRAEPRRTTSRPAHPRWVVAALVAASIAVITAVAPVRSAVAGLLGVDGVHITRNTHPSPPPPASTTAPSTAPANPLDALNLGLPTTLADAARLVGFPMRLPTTPAYRQPDAVYVGTPPAGGMASMVYLPRPDRPAPPSGDVAALLTEFRGHIEAGFFQKMIGPDATLEAVQVGSAAGYWLAGSPHEFFYVNADGSVDTETLRLATNTLLWSVGGITYRFESGLSRDAAVALATSMR